MKKIIERLILWVAGHFGTEKQMIPSLHNIPYDKRQYGRMYEWYGRIVKAVRNPRNVVVHYSIIPNKDMSQNAVNLLCQNCGRMTVKGEINETTDVGLGEALKADGSLEVSEDIEGKPCQMCCMYMSLPCPQCDFTAYWVKVAEKRQNATDQNAYMRLMKRRING